MLAGHTLPANWNWQEICKEVHPKENYFLPRAEMRSLLDEPGEGRRTLAEEAARQYRRIRQLCLEDIAVLEDRTRAWIARST